MALGQEGAAGERENPVATEGEAAAGSSEEEKGRAVAPLKEQEKKVSEAAGISKGLNTTMDMQPPAYTSHQMTPQGHRTSSRSTWIMQDGSE